MFEIIVEKEGLGIHWDGAVVPTVPDVLGQRAIDCMPYIMQGFVRKPAETEKGIDFDRKLYIIRRILEQEYREYLCSNAFLTRTIAYKGMFLVKQLRTFYPRSADRIKGTKLFYQEHSFISNRSGGKRYYIGILCTLFKNSSYDIQLSVKINALFCLCRFPDESLHNIWHTVDCSLSEYIRYGRNHTPSPESAKSFLF